MNVYDFDETIYDGDSTRDFYLYCLRQHPGVLRSLPRQAVAAAGMILGVLPRGKAKEKAFSFLRHVPDVDVAVEGFWQKSKDKLEGWYLQQKRDDDVVVSASPDFVLRPLCQTLGVALIATKVDKHTGLFESPNCRGEEKVTRFLQAYPEAVVEAVYSDSLSDTPLAHLAQQAFLVKKGSCQPWPPAQTT